EERAMSRQPDLFDKAADCERAMNMVSDPHERIALKILREMWISLANESVGFSECDLTKQIAAIEELQCAAVNHGKTTVP
ncbi:MAG TPA: hypothetical protein VNX28_19765, partial [Gemmataceae bacterium]|nr:hypothetical protein [Gemmataceae bacterium]